ncbi:hypothetical protein Tco_0167937 [Tanacetum coccineum]
MPSKSLNKLIESQIIDNCKKGLGYNSVPPPYTGNFMPLTPDLSFTGLDEFVNKPVVENRKSDEDSLRTMKRGMEICLLFGGNPKGGKITGKGTIKTVNAGDSKLLLLGITYYCWLLKLNAASLTYTARSKEKSQLRHKLTTHRLVTLQALVDGKKKIITESTMRRDLQLEDAEGVDCLPNATIFEQLALMGDKGKGIMVEEPVKSMTKKDLVRLDEEIALKLQAKFDEEERLAREKDKANVALTEEWDDIQAKNDADYQLAQRLQAQEQE